VKAVSERLQEMIDEVFSLEERNKELEAHIKSIEELKENKNEG